MKFSVNSKIFEKFAGVEIGVLVITGMDNRENNKDNSIVPLFHCFIDK